MLREHCESILNWFRAQKRFNCRIVEGLNGLVKLRFRKAFGFRPFQAIEVALYHGLGGLPQPTLVVLFYMASDLVDKALHWEDDVAHCIAIGGFIGGMAPGLNMLMGRQVQANGDDVVSVIFDRSAWRWLDTFRERAEQGPVSRLMR